jgi:hypothetical protein
MFNEPSSDEGKDATVMDPKFGTDTHGSPASEEGVKEDLGKC